MKDSTQNKQKSKDSSLLMLLTLVSRILGIIKARVITTAFGATSTADVINVAFLFPNNLRKIFAEGAMTSAFIPSFSKCVEKNYRNTLLSIMLSAQLFIFSIIIIIFVFFSKQIFSFITDFNGDELQLGASLLPYFMAFLAFISIANVFSAVLQTDKQFLFYGIAPLFYSITLIIFLLLFSDKFDAMAMAYGVLLASIIQFAFTFAIVFKKGYRVKLNINFKNNEFKKILKTWIIVVGSAITTIFAQQFSVFLASSLSTGNATAFSNSLIFFSTPYGIVYTGIVTVVYPLLSQNYCSNQKKEFKDNLAYGIDGMINLFIPATILLIFLSKEFVAVLLQNGKFTFADTLLTASVINFLVLGLTIIGLNALLNRALLAKDMAKLSFKITVIQAIIDVILSFILIKKIGIIALPIANTISFCITLILHFIYLKNDIDFKHTLFVFFKTLIANLPFLAILIAYKFFTPIWYQSGSTLKNFIIIIVLNLGLAIILLFSYSVFKIPFIEYFHKRRK